MMFANVAVTGGSGRLGRYVVAELSRHCNVTVLDIAPPADGGDWQRCDVLVPPDLSKAMAGQDAVVHLAGLDLDSDAAPDAFLRVNALGTWNVLQAAGDAGVKRVVQCSSVTATGLNEARVDFPPHYLPVDEAHPMAPVHPYGVSKQLQEAIAQSFSRRGALQVVSLRLMLVMFAENLALVADRAQDAACRWLFYYISPEDAARAFRCALEAEQLPFDTFFITARDTCHDDATLQWMSSALGVLPQVRKPQVYGHNPRASVFDGSRARDILGFEASGDWQAMATGQGTR